MGDVMTHSAGDSQIAVQVLDPNSAVANQTSAAATDNPTAYHILDQGDASTAEQIAYQIIESEAGLGTGQVELAIAEEAELGGQVSYQIVDEQGHVKQLSQMELETLQQSAAQTEHGVTYQIMHQDGS